MRDILYNSTRGGMKGIKASEAIVMGLASDGGLFVPSHIPTLDVGFHEIKDMSYQEVACKVLGLFLQDFTDEEIAYCVNHAYDSKFDNPLIAPLVKKGEEFYVELFHGATIAFKDMALSILPYLMMTSAKKLGITEEIVVLTATSGDTGKAALEGFSDVEGTKIVVFYPKGGVSKIQERQMTTTTGKNTFVVGIEGNFDDAQNGVKEIFNDTSYREELLKKGYRLSSANSINIGRLLPQVVYYVYTYAQMLKKGEISIDDRMNVVVPTGNFGNILAAYYAKQMGTPIGKLVCASNDNKVLYDFFETGTYDRRRDFILTISPSMDILVSSNVERLLYEISGENGESINEMMESLKKEGVYSITTDMKEKLDTFDAAFATEEETYIAIKEMYEKTGYILDPHTAVARVAYTKAKEKLENKTVIMSTASPYKFTKSALGAIDKKFEKMDDFALLNELLELSKVKIPNAVHKINERKIHHKEQCTKEKMPEVIKAFLA